ncbi:MAG: AAA family ATPase [Siculibacillus sp.]|nr:AAA family ATPase [Siculibacillus sp.]
MPSATGTGVVLGTARSIDGRTIEYSAEAGDAIGIDCDLDDPADQAIFNAIVARIASYGVSGVLCTVGRLDGGKTARVKILLRAAEKFPSGSPRAQTRRFIGHTTAHARAVEAYAAGRQFVVSGFNGKAGCAVEIRIDGIPSEALPPVSALPGLTAAMWGDLLAFIDGGCGLGLERCPQERRLTGNGVVADLPVLLDEVSGRITDGREAAITRAASKAVGAVFESRAVPLAAMADPVGMCRLAEMVAWGLVERDIDLERPRDGGSGRESHWSPDDVAERVGRFFDANAATFRATRIKDQAFPDGTPIPDPQGVAGRTIEEVASDVIATAAALVPEIDDIRREAEAARRTGAGLSPMSAAPPDLSTIGRLPPATADAAPEPTTTAGKEPAARSIAGVPASYGDVPADVRSVLADVEFGGSYRDLEIPPTDFAVGTVFPIGDVSILYGDGGTGKSWLALQLSLAIAGGAEWFGMETKPGRALFYSAEDVPDNLRRRFKGLIQSEGVSGEVADRVGIMQKAGGDSIL